MNRGDAVATTWMVRGVGRRYEHVCRECGHVVATHFHRFTAGLHARRWLMECALCGRGADERASLSSVAAAAPDADPSRPPPSPRVFALDAGATDLLARAAAAADSPATSDGEDDWG